MGVHDSAPSDKVQWISKVKSEIQSAAALTFEQFVRNCKGQKPIEQDPALFKTYGETKDMLETILDITEEDKYHDIKITFKSAFAIAMALASGVSRSVADVRGYIRTRKAKEERDMNAKKAKMLSDEVKRVQDQAKEQARKLKEKKEEEAAEAAKIVDPLFQVDFTKFGAEVSEVLVNEIGVKAEQDPMFFDCPFVIRGGNEILLWCGDDKVARALASWAKTYHTTGECADVGRTQYPMKEKSGKEESDELLQKFSPKPLCDISEVPGGKAFLAGVWLYGFVAHHRHVSLAPNSASVIKLLFDGDVSMMLLDLSSLWAFMKAKNPSVATDIREVLTMMHSAGASDLKAMVDSGVHIYHTRLLAQQAIYVPQGWLIIEDSCNDRRLHYGIRKSYIVNSEKAASDYALCTELTRGSGKNVQRMESISSCLSQGVEALRAAAPFAPPLAAPVSAASSSQVS